MVLCSVMVFKNDNCTKVGNGDGRHGTILSGGLVTLGIFCVVVEKIISKKFGV